MQFAFLAGAGCAHQFAGHTIAVLKNMILAICCTVRFVGFTAMLTSWNREVKAKTRRTTEVIGSWITGQTGLILIIILLTL